MKAMKWNCRRKIDSQASVRFLGSVLLLVKACSWALRELGERDPKAVRAFLRHQTLAPRVVREVRRKLDTGRKAKRRT